MDVDGYLRRFIDLEYRLPDSLRGDFYASLYDRFNLLELSKNRRGGAELLSDFVEAFSKLSDIFQLSLRTTEQCFAQFNIVVRTTPMGVQFSSSLLAFLIALKARDFPLYGSFSRGTPDMEGVIHLINGLPGGQEYWDSFYGLEIEASLAIAKGPYPHYSIGAESHRRKLEKHGKDTPQGKRAGEALELMGQMSRNGLNGLRSTIRRIELTEQFTIG